MAQYLMQARDSVTGAMFRWAYASADFAAAGYPGPNAAQEVAVVAVSGEGGGAGVPPDASITLAKLANGGQFAQSTGLQYKQSVAPQFDQVIEDVADDADAVFTVPIPANCKCRLAYIVAITLANGTYMHEAWRINLNANASAVTARGAPQRVETSLNTTTDSTDSLETGGYVEVSLSNTTSGGLPAFAITVTNRTGGVANVGLAANPESFVQPSTPS